MNSVPGYIAHSLARSLIADRLLLSYTLRHHLFPSLPPVVPYTADRPHLIFMACMKSSFLASPTAATTSPIASTSLTPAP